MYYRLVSYVGFYLFFDKKNHLIRDDFFHALNVRKTFDKCFSTFKILDKTIKNGQKKESSENLILILYAVLRMLQLFVYSHRLIA